MKEEAYRGKAQRGAYAKAIAQTVGMDGLPDAAYRAAVTACKGNLRAVLQRVESGQLQLTARQWVQGQLATVPLDGRHNGERSRLQALLAEIG